MASGVRWPLLPLQSTRPSAFTAVRGTSRKSTAGLDRSYGHFVIGPFGGEMLETEGGSIERVPTELIEALASGPGPMPTPNALPGAARIVTYRWDPATASLMYAANLQETFPLDETRSLAPKVALAALADVAMALRSLHDHGAAHGDVRLATVRMASDGPLLLVPEQRFNPGASLRARLRHGDATPADVAFAAPEVATGFEATAAADVYALGALAHRMISGFAPLGQIDFGPARHASSPLRELAALVAAALSSTPSERPSLVALEVGLRSAANLAGGVAAEVAGGPYRSASARPHAAQSPAQARAMSEGASNMSAILVLVLIVGGFFVIVGAIWLVAVNWDALGEAGRFALLALLTSGVAGTGLVVERKENQRSGFALLVVASQLLWADAAYLLHLLDVMEKPGPWAAAAGAVTTVSLALAVWKRSSLASTLGALGFAVFAACLGRFLSTGSDLGPATWSLVVAFGYAALSALGQLLGRERVGVPFSFGAVACGWLAAVLALVLLADQEHRLFGTTFPYVLVALALPFTQIGPATYRMPAIVAASGLVVAIPSLEALIRHDVIGYMAIAIAIGLVVLAGSFVVPWLARDTSRQHTGVLVGLVSAVSAPSVLFLVECGGKAGLDALDSPAGKYLIAVCVVPFLLIGLSYALSSRATEKSAYRLVELTGLLQFFGLFTLQSILCYDDFFYPVVLGGVAVVVLGGGVATRRATLVLFASISLVLNLWIQYFAKLRHAFPTSVLVLGFGLGLLAFGVLYERRVRHLLPKLASWS